MGTTQKMSARQRIEALLDDNSFVEIGGSVKARSTNFNLQGDAKENDGVITGFGLIEGKLCYVYSQDKEVLGGTIGEMHARKIIGLYSKAISMGAPIVGLIDSNGVRLKESTDAIHALAKLYKCMAKASGVVPQLTGIFGNCGGGLSILASMSDFTIADADARFFVNSPNAIFGNYTEKNDTAAISYQAKETDNIDYYGQEAEVIATLRNLVSLLPENNDEEIFAECTDDLNRSVAGIDNNIEDVTTMLQMIGDNGEVYEFKKDYATGTVTAFIKLNGATVGVVANRTKAYNEEGEVVFEADNKITSKGAVKAADFVNLCDAFNIPVLSITNVNGFMACECGEKKMAKAVSKLAYAFAGATVPKVNLIVGEGYGASLAVMNSKGIGADMVYSWPNVKVGAMQAQEAARIISDDSDIDVTKAEFENIQNNVESAASRGYIDTIIDPSETRKYLIGAFEMLYTKVEYNPEKKHGTI